MLRFSRIGLLALVLTCLPLSGANTQITDTIVTPFGTNFNGLMTIACPAASTNTEQIAATTLSLVIVNGAFSQAIHPYDHAYPAATCNVNYTAYDANGKPISWRQQWLIPTTNVTLAIRDVTVATINAGGGTSIAGVTSFSGRVGPVTPGTGDYAAAQVTNAVSTLGTYTNPTWISSLAYSKITGAPNAPTVTSPGIPVSNGSAWGIAGQSAIIAALGYPPVNAVGIGQPAGIAPLDFSAYVPDVYLRPIGSPGSCGDATHVCAVTTDAQGRVSGTSSVPISTSGVGTVTHTLGPLPAGQLVKGNSSGDIQTADLSGDISTSGGTVATLPTVNGGSGACGDATHVCAITTNPKGLVTAQSAVAISAGGSGTVTHTAGALTANQIMLGNGAADSKVGNLSGDVATSGSAVTTLATVNSGPGACGDSTHVCVINTNGKGLVTSQSQALISGGGGGTSYTSGILDWGFSRTTTTLTFGANCLPATPCNVLIGEHVQQFTGGPYVLTYSSGTTGTVFVYIDPDSPTVIKAGTTTGITLTSSGVTIVPSTASILGDAYPVATWEVVASIFATTPTGLWASYASYKPAPRAGFNMRVTPGDRDLLDAIATLNTATPSATPIFDLSSGAIQKITLSTNVTSSTATNLQVGFYSFLICLDATPRTFVWPTNILGGDTIGVTANKCNSQMFQSDGATLYAVGSMKTNL